MKDAYSLAIDLKNAMTNGREDNFTVLLFRLIAKSDSDNREKFMKGFPVEVAMMDVYKLEPDAYADFLPLQAPPLSDLQAVR